MGSYLDSAITEQHEQGLISLDPLQQQGWGRHLYLFHTGQISTLGEQAGQVTRLACTGSLPMAVSWPLQVQSLPLSHPSPLTNDGESKMPKSLTSPQCSLHTFMRCCSM